MKEVLLSVVLVLLIMSCGDGNVRIEIDPEVQLSEDSVEITEYMIANGYSNFSTTESGVRYFIIDEGLDVPANEGDDSVSIKESYFVYFNYIGMLTDGTIFDTNIKEVGDSIRLQVQADTVGVEEPSSLQINLLNRFTEGRVYSPFEITYSSSGWTTDDLFLQGFSDGIAATFNQIRVGGRVIIAMPSSLGYGSRSDRPIIIPANAVLIFELRPIFSKKQG